MAPAPPETKPRRVVPIFVGVLLIIASLVLALMTAGFGFGYLNAGLNKMYLTASEPGTHALDLRPGSYDLTRATSAQPEDAGTLTIRSTDPSIAAVAPTGAGSYIEIEGVRYDLLASIDVTTREPVSLELEGDPAHFPVVVRRDQITWMQHTAAVTAGVAILPIACLLTGVVLIIREKQRQTRELVEFVSGVR